MNRREKMLRVIVKKRIRENSYDQLIGLYEELVMRSREEEGCISYEICSHVDDPQLIAIIEEWTDREVLDEHMKTEHFKRLVPIIDGYTEEQISFDIYNVMI